MELRCNHPAALVSPTHTHKHIKGSMKVVGEKGWQSIPKHTGRYTPEIGTVYARCVLGFVDRTARPESLKQTELKQRADEADLSEEQQG